MPLSYMQEESIRDRNGNCRCPYCGKYRRREDFPDQDGHVYFGTPDGETIGHIHVAPVCRVCMDSD